MNCGICGENKSKRTISGIPMCEECFAKLSLLRNNDIKTQTVDKALPTILKLEVLF